MTDEYYEVVYYDKMFAEYIHMKNFEKSGDAIDYAERMKYAFEIHTRVVKHVTEIVREF